MQAGPKLKFDSVNYADDSVPITDYRTDQNKFEITCGKCGRTFFADEKAAEFFNRQIEHDLDRPFLCGCCEIEASETANPER